MPAELSITLPRDRASPSAARHAVRLYVGPGDKRNSDLALVITELVTNAVVHGRGRITLTLRRDGRCIQGEVADEGSGFEPNMRKQGPHDYSGRGLSIVDALSSRWGVLEGSTQVWFELGPPDQPVTASAFACERQCRVCVDAAACVSSTIVGA